MPVNGQPVEIRSQHESALDFIRGDLGLTGAKLVCGTGVCGACTISVDGVPVASCVLPVEELEGRDVRTVEGIAQGERLHPVQAAFVAWDALQCGYCTPGFVIEAVAFYDRWRGTRGMARPSRDEIAHALAGHLCRCGAYENIYRAVADACEGIFDDAGRVSGPRPARWTKLPGRRSTTDAVDAAVGDRHSPWHTATSSRSISPGAGYGRRGGGGDLAEPGSASHAGQPLARSPLSTRRRQDALDRRRRRLPRPAGFGARSAQARRS